MLKVTDLTCEYRNNPLGLDDPYPRFSWQLRSNLNSTMQTGYRIQVSVNEVFSDVLWDTGDVCSDQSVLVPYGGPKLLPRTKYYYRIKVTDNHNEQSGWSAPSFWETGMLHPDEWSARWIMADNEDALKLNGSPLLRRECFIPKHVVSARVYVTSLGMYTLYLNGKRIGEDYFTPGWTSYSHRLQYQTYDVTDMLSYGKNVIGAILGNGWYAGFIAWSGERGFYGKKRALLLQMHVRFTDGTEQTILSDSNWKSTEGPIQMSEIYHGEVYDARMDHAGWTMPEYDAHDWCPIQLLEHPYNMLVAQEVEAPRIMNELRPIRLINTPAGEMVLDFGQNMVGFVRFSVQGKAGDKVVLRHAEVLDRSGNFYTANLRGAKQRVEYILKGEKTETFHPNFTFQGFRYVCIDSYPGEVSLERFVGCVVHSSLKQTGLFECSNKLVNQLQHNILWGQKGNFVDVPTDCPQRDERHGWTGDAQMFIRTACFHMNTALFFRKWLRDLSCDQTDMYGVTNVVPNVREASYAGAAAWGDAAVICPWTIYLCYGDDRVLAEQYSSMKRWVDYIQRQGDDPFIWNTGEQFGDWLALDNGIGAWIGKTPVDLIATAFYANSAHLLSQTAKRLGFQKDADQYHSLHKNIKAAFQKRFVISGGLLRADTQTAYVLALEFDLLEEKDRFQAAAMLAELLHRNKDHLNTGFVGTPYLCHVLSRFGYHDLACKLLLHTDYPSWLYPVTKNATTIWEHWDGVREDGSFWDDIMNSFNHYSYGSIGDWMYRCITGLNADPVFPGYKHFYISPKPVNGMNYARATYQSPYGTILSEWTKQNETYEVSIAIPENTTATVLLPQAKIGYFDERDRGDESCAYKSPVQMPDGVRYELGSGYYRFCYSLGLIRG